ncbi:MAG: DUF1573 domain-containing protein [Oscillospiraceae bacterium]|nr:DUF1573 domain-containing protein [Oscillospiraceae bacterium]
MESELITEYQTRAEQVLSRNKSLLDILTKLQCANGRVARSVIKAVTTCGCIEVDGCKNPPDKPSGQLRGQLCDDCHTTVRTEIGEALFYTASLCSALGIGLEEVIVSDLSRSDMMGSYSLR